MAVGGDHNLLDSDVPLRLRRVGGDSSQLAAIAHGSQRILGPGWHRVDRCVHPGACQRLQLLRPIRLAIVHDRRGTLRSHPAGTALTRGGDHCRSPVGGKLDEQAPRDTARAVYQHGLAGADAQGVANHLIGGQRRTGTAAPVSKDTEDGSSAGKERLVTAIDIAKYDPAWPEQFRTEASKLTALLEPWLATPVEHIGSTSVPGLAAKPSLDMMAGVHDLQAATDAIPVLTSHGYTHAQHRPATLWFHKARTESAPGQGLHLTEPGSNLWRERLAFRDALRADPLLAHQYQELKERLATGSRDIAAYTAGKREFVVQVLARSGVVAELWRQA